MYKNILISTIIKTISTSLIIVIIKTININPMKLVSFVPVPVQSNQSNELILLFIILIFFLIFGYAESSYVPNKPYYAIIISSLLSTLLLSLGFIFLSENFLFLIGMPLYLLIILIPSITGGWIRNIKIKKFSTAPQGSLDV